MKNRGCNNISDNVPLERHRTFFNPVDSRLCPEKRHDTGYRDLVSAKVLSVLNEGERIGNGVMVGYK